MKTSVLVLACTLTFTLTQAQNLTGIWRGQFSSGMGIFQQQCQYELQINQLPNKGLRGVTYSYIKGSFYAKSGMRGINQVAAKSVIVKEDTTLEFRGTATQPCPMTCYLDYTKEGNKEILQGTFTSVVESSLADCGSGTVYLERVTTTDFTKEDFLLKKSARPQAAPTRPPVASKPQAMPPLAKKEPQKQGAPTFIVPKKTDSTIRLSPGKDTVVSNLPVTPLPVPPALKERTNELVRTIVTHSPDIKVDLYDNGEIDGDTITVYHNNEVVAYRKGLSTKPITLQVKASSQNKTHEFVMYANNLGKIPPNTALMVVTTGGQRYELSISSSNQKNAKVIIEYQPEP